ncbi:MAG: hypothetical protein ACOX4O_12870 [Eubacteriales bacterium]
MKRFAFKILIVLLLVLTSCVNSESAAASSENRYLDNCYMYMSLRKDDGIGAVLNRFNINTGEVTVLCPDPLCEHGNDCIFSTVNEFYVFDNILILPFDYHFDEATQEAWYEAVRYDFVTNEAKVFLKYGSPGAAMSEFSIVDGYLWGKYLLYEVDGPNYKPIGDYRTYRYNIIADELEYMDNFVDIPTFIYDDRYYFINDIMIYSTDLSGNDKIETDLPFCTGKHFALFDLSEMDNGYLYYFGYDSDSDSDIRIEYIIKINLLTGEYSQFELPQLQNPKMYDGFLYYVPICDEYQYYLGHDDFQNKDIVNNTGGKLMRIPLSGGEPEILIDLGDEYLPSHNAIIEVDGKLIIGYGGFDTHEMFGVMTWYGTGGGKIVYDTVSGKYAVYPRTWNRPNGFLDEQNVF